MITSYGHRQSVVSTRSCWESIGNEWRSKRTLNFAVTWYVSSMSVPRPDSNALQLLLNERSSEMLMKVSSGFHAVFTSISPMGLLTNHAIWIQTEAVNV